MSAPCTVSAAPLEPDLPAPETSREASAAVEAPNSVQDAAVADVAPTPAKPAPPKIVKTSKITVKAKKVVKKLGTPAASAPAGARVCNSGDRLGIAGQAIQTLSAWF